jgi:hypothetical protein
MRDFIKNMADASSIDSLPFKTTVKNILWWVKDNP